MLPEGLSSKFVRKMTNSLATYGRLKPALKEATP
jgi:hypothetical protein